MKKLITLSLSTILTLTMATSAFAEAGSTGVTKKLEPSVDAVTTATKTTKPAQRPEKDPVAVTVTETPTETPVPVLISYKPTTTDFVVTNNIAVTLDGTPVTFTKDILNVNGSTYFPMREVLNKLGVTDEQIAWNGTDKSVTITTAEDTIVFTIGSNVAVIDGKNTTMNVVPFINEGSTYLPIRVTAETLGFDVDYDDDTRTIVLTSSETPVDPQTPVVDPVAPFAKDATVMLNGKKVETKSPALKVDDVVYYPVTELSVAIGASEDFTTDDNGNITLTNSVNGDKVTFNKLSKDYTVNDKTFTADTETIDYNGTIYAPVNEIATAFGYKVSTDEAHPDAFGLTKDGVLENIEKNNL